MFTRGDLNPAVYVAAAHLRALMGLLMVTCLFTLVHFFFAPPANPRPLAACSLLASAAHGPTQLLANDLTLEGTDVSFLSWICTTVAF